MNNGLMPLLSFIAIIAMIPVALWLLIFKNSPTSALIMLVVGFAVNTVYISTFLRPKIAAERSKV